MKLSWFLLITLLCSSVLCAQDDAAEELSEADRVRARFENIGDVIDAVTITDADIDAFVEQYPAFKKATAADEKYAELLAENWKKAFDHCIDTDAFDSWQTDAGIDGKAWLRKSFRIQTFYVRDLMTEGVKNGRKAVESSRERIEAAKDLLPEGQYKESLAGLDETEATLDELAEAAETLPAGAAAEAGVLEDRKSDIEKAMNGAE